MTAAPPRPASVQEAAAAIADLRAAGTPLRPTGTGSRRDWGGADPQPVAELSTLGLNRIVEYNPGDFTAIIDAGVPLAEAQMAFAGEGQWLALDPAEPGGSIGGLFATADSGPGRHRYGGPRDLIIGATVVLSDGTVATSGGRVIKNVAGYDLGKLFTGSRGTLGLLASVAVRLHPLPARTATVSATTDDPAALGRVALVLARSPIEAMALDAWWRGDSGGLLVRFGGAAAAEQAHRVAPLLAALPAVEVLLDDETVWAAQRSGQRSTGGAVLKVSARLTDLPAVIRAARAQLAHVVSRAGLGLSWLEFEPDAALAGRVDAVRHALAPRHCLVLDGADVVANPPLADPALAALTARLKARFDPARLFRPGAFGGI
jgi:glycolate oxidase FAD binding subunit